MSLAVALGSWSRPAGAEAGPDLREGDRAMDSLDYGRAIAAFERVTRSRDASAEDLVHAYSALLRCQVVLGNEASARLAAEQLLEIDPGARLEGGNIPPRVTRFFEEFQREYQRSGETVVTVELPDRIPSGRGMEVSARITRGRRGVASLRVQMIFGDGAPVTTVDLAPRERTWSGRVQVPATFDSASSTLRYWALARAPSGAALGGLGSEDEPMVIAPTAGGRRSNGSSRRDPDIVADPDRHDGARHDGNDGDSRARNEEFFRQRYPLTSQWWFWTGIAVVVAGGVVTAAILATDEGEPAPHGDDGDLVLP